MAGSLNHLVDHDGTFSMETIENMGDAHEALEECFEIIFYLAGGDSTKVSAACNALGHPDPWEKPYEGSEFSTAPMLVPRLTPETVPAVEVQPGDRPPFSMFFVQDPDRPAYVIAPDFALAVKHWTRMVAAENSEPVGSVEPPQGVQMVADRETLLMDGDLLRRWTEDDALPETPIEAP